MGGPWVFRGRGGAGEVLAATGSVDGLPKVGVSEWWDGNGRETGVARPEVTPIPAVLETAMPDTAYQTNFAGKTVSIPIPK